MNQQKKYQNEQKKNGCKKNQYIMNIKVINIVILFLLLSLLSFSQQITNIHFEQEGKQIHIYYDLEGEGFFNVKVYCSEDNGNTWGKQLEKVKGAVGENQIPDKNKMIIWDVLQEREELRGNLRFKVDVQSENRVLVYESVNEELLLEAYDRLTKDIRASHILIMVDENATPEDTLKAYNKISRVIDDISAGKEFSIAAIEYSDDPSAKDTKAIPNKQRAKKGNKGDLGYFTVFNMLYPFECAAYNTQIGDISPIIRTKYGYHIINVTDVKDAMGSAQVAHIFVALRPDASEQDSIRKAEKINNIYTKIQEGLSFEDAVAQYSEDKGSIKNNGQLSPFTCNRVVPEFVEVVDMMEVGEISAPIKTDYGFHIVKLIDSNKPGSFEEESTRLKERLAKDGLERR
mgnify:CR=1 FL=1